MLKTRLKKKDKKKKFKDIKPQRHQRTDNLNYYSEEIAKEIIDKIISLTITKIFSMKIEKGIPDFCMAGIKKMFNNLMQISYINHDNDDTYYINNSPKYANSDEKRYKYTRHFNANKNKKQIAELDLLSLIKTNKDLQKEMVIKEKNISDYLSSSFEQPKNTYIKLPNIIRYDIKVNKNNFWEFINQPKSFGPHRIATHSNKSFPLAQASNQIKEIEETQIKGKTHYYNSYNLSKAIKSPDRNSNFQEFPMKKRIFTIFKMNSLQKIEDNKISKPIETPDIIELRNQKMEELIKLKQEENLKKQKLKEKKTLDKNLNINNIKLNFIDKQKSRAIKDQRKYIEEQIKKGNFTTDIRGNIVIINEIKPDILNEDLPLVYAKFREIKINSDFNKIEQGKNSSKNKNNSNILNIKKKKDSLIYENKFKNSSLPEYLNYKIEPSGSNFDLIKPETGVIIREKTKSKSGGNQFFEKFNKLSINDFNKTLKETIDNEKQYIKSKIIEKSNRTTSDFKTIKTFKEKFQNISKIDEKKLFEKTFTKEFRKKNIKNSIISKKLNKSKSDIFIKTKKNSFFEDLFVHEDKDNNIQKYIDNTIDSKILDEQIKLNQKNLFLKNIKRRNNNKFKNLHSLRMIDSFNKSIVLGSRNTSGFDNLIALPNMKNLPILPLKRNKSNFFMENNPISNRTTFYRTRIKKNYK